MHPRIYTCMHVSPSCVHIYIYILQKYTSEKVHKWKCKSEKVKRWSGETCKVKQWSLDKWNSEWHKSKCEKVSRCKGETTKGEKVKRWKGEKGKRWKGEKVKRWKRWSGETCKEKQWPLDEWNSDKTHVTARKGVKVQMWNEERWKGKQVKTIS